MSRMSGKPVIFNSSRTNDLWFWLLIMQLVYRAHYIKYTQFLYLRTLRLPCLLFLPATVPEEV